MDFTLDLILSFIQIGSLSLHVIILFGTKLLNMFKIRKFKNRRNNILAQSHDISIQIRLYFEFE